MSRQSESLVKDMQRKLAISNLAQVLYKCKAIARSKTIGLQVGRESMSAQLTHLGEGIRFYGSLGIIDQDVIYKASRLADRFSELFYNKFGLRKESMKQSTQ